MKSRAINFQPIKTSPMKFFYVATLATVLLVLSAPAWVHHSGAMFDRGRQTKITGTVADFQWTNPHASFKVEVPGSDGKSETWSIEMNGPNNLVRAGWKRTTIKPGDKVTVTLNPLRDGRPGGWYLGITLADGRTLGGAGDPGGGEAPAAPANP